MKSSKNKTAELSVQSAQSTLSSNWFLGNYSSHIADNLGPDDALTHLRHSVVEIIEFIALPNLPIEFPQTGDTTQ